MSYFPLFLNIIGARFFVVGSGKIALAKVETILEFGGEVVVLGWEEELGLVIVHFHVDMLDSNFKKPRSC